MPRYKYSLVACARWEATQIQEWIEYHRSIGFDHIYLYSNDDHPAALFKAVAAYVHGRDPFVTFRHWPVVGQQAAIYFHFMETLKNETEWFSFIDVDEFVVLRDVDDIHAFMLEFLDNTDCLYFNWAIHGNGPRRKRACGPTLTSYPWRASGADQHTKMLCRSSLIEASAVRRGYEAGLGAFWHFLDKYRLPEVRCRNVLHEDMDGYADDVPHSTTRMNNRPGLAQALLKRAYIAHFQFRSEDDFIRRWRRGGFPNGEMWRAVFESGNHKAILAQSNTTYDPYLATYWHRYTAAGLRSGIDDGPVALDNVALNKPSWQSSESDSNGKNPAGSWTEGHGNDGIRRRGYGFHTEFETQPWWIVDLLSVHFITEIRIYNRADTPEAARQAGGLQILVSADGASWGMIYDHTSGTFGLDGQPLILRPSPEPLCRFAMLRLRGPGWLHLNEVAIYGNAADEHIPLIGSALPVSGLK
jgi:Glycosyl transferase family 2/F5/8 type C domain